MIDESDRVWAVLDNYGKSISDHCQRLTKLEQDHLFRDKGRANRLVWLLAGIAVLESIFIVVDHIWLAK